MTQRDRVLVLDFGAQDAQLIARRVREAHVYSEIVPYSTTADAIAADPQAAIILSGGPASVHVPNAPLPDPKIYELGIPVFGICYGAQLIAQQLGGTVEETGAGEYGRTPLTVDSKRAGALLRELPEEQSVWMSHGDAISVAPEGFTVTASTPGAPIAVLEDRSRRIGAVQFHPEVGHTDFGQDVLKHFLFDIAECRPSWTHMSILDEAVEEVQVQVGDGRVICGLSGGVDSAVAAALVHRAVGDQIGRAHV